MIERVQIDQEGTMKAALHFLMRADCLCTDDGLEGRIFLFQGRQVVHPLHHHALSLVCNTHAVSAVDRFNRVVSSSPVPWREFSSMFWFNISTTSSFLSVSTTCADVPASRQPQGQFKQLRSPMGARVRPYLGSEAGSNQARHATAGSHLQHALISHDVRVRSQVET